MRWVWYNQKTARVGRGRPAAPSIIPHSSGFANRKNKQKTEADKEDLKELEKFEKENK